MGVKVTTWLVALWLTVPPVGLLTPLLVKEKPLCRWQVSSPPEYLAPYRAQSLIFLCPDPYPLFRFLSNSPLL